MLNLNSARLREETPHLSDALKRRAQSVINDKSIDAQTRAVIRYGLQINDPWLPELVGCVDAGERSTRKSHYLRASYSRTRCLCPDPFSALVPTTGYKTWLRRGNT